MTSTQMNAIPNPAIGLIVFCTDCTPASLHQFVGSSWSSLSNSASPQTISANCTANGFAGSFVAGTTLTGAHFSVTLTNSSFSSASFAVNISDLVLSGANAGISVNNVSLTPGGTGISTVNIGAGQSVILYYNLTGSPNVSGSLTGTWTKITVTCYSSTSVSSLSSQVATTYCTSATVNGFFASTFAMQTTNTFVIAITNTGSTSLNLVAPTAANLGLSYSGTTSPVFSVSTVTQSTIGALAAGATRTFTYTLAGTPTSVGTLTFNWAYGDLTCTKTRNIDAGASNFTSTYCNTGAINGSYNTIIAMTAANTFTVTINNTSGVTSPSLPAANVSQLVLSGPGAAGLTVSTATPAASTLAAGGSRTYTYTLSGTPTSTGTLTATWNYMGMNCSKETFIGLTPTVANICNPSNPTVVVDVTNAHTGKTWMDRNLGANRAATSSTDTQSYGSLYQWGRGSDGHQCVNRYAGDGVTTSANTALNATVSTDTPPHGNFILVNLFNDWRSPSNDNLWQGVNGTNNPCPSGYRIPTEAELNNERLSWVLAPISSTNSPAGAFASPLKLPMAGVRSRTDGLPFNVGIWGYYWSSAVNGPSAVHLQFTSSSANMIFNARAFGFSVRCIKD